MNKIVIWIVGFNCAFLQRNISPCPRQTKVLCYKALVRPLVEYACTVWDPHTQKNISKLEMLQRRYARFVFNDYQRTSSVNSMLQELQWPTLQERRAQYKVVMIYRCVNFLVDIPPAYVAPAPMISQRGHSQRSLCHLPEPLPFSDHFSQMPSECGTRCPRKWSTAQQ